MLFAELLTGFGLGCNHFKAMFIKRFLNSKREKKALVTQVLLPIIMTIIGLALARVTPSQTEDPSRVIDLSKDLVAGTTGNGYFADFRSTPDLNMLKVSYTHCFLRSSLRQG